MSSPYETSTVLYPYQSAIDLKLRLVCKRYLPIAGAVSAHASAGLTPIFAHCTGSHKECWEPVIEVLLKLVHPTTGAPVVREAWSIDWQSHGEASIVNEDVLKGRKTGLSIQEWAIGLAAFLKSDYLAGHNVVAIGHSSGSSAILLSSLAFSGAELPYKSMILVEPSLITRAAFNHHFAERTLALATMRKLLENRREIWANRHEAMAYFKKRIPWKIWDTRILETYMEHGLREIMAEEEGQCVSKITLACTKIQEQAAYGDEEANRHFEAIEQLQILNRTFPVHCILGERIDLVPRYAHESTLSARNMASVGRVANAGHYVLQENPIGLASCIGHILVATVAPEAKL